MKTNLLKLRIVFLLVLIILVFLVSMESNAQEGVRQVEGKLIASCQWIVGDQRLLCTVKEKVIEQSVKSPLGGLVPDRIFTIHSEAKDQEKPLLYELKTLDHFVEFVILGDGNLLTVWTGGSAFHFNVFSFNNGIITLVLEDGSRTMPEIAYPGIKSISSLFAVADKERSPALIITDWCWESTNGKSELHPCTAKVYIWDSKLHIYQMEGRKWEERFRWPYNQAKPVTIKHE